MQTLRVPQGDFQLSRFPVRPKESLRAWDAADEYILATLQKPEYSIQGKRILVANDGFGALSVSLASQLGNRISSLTVLSDSFLSQQAIRSNCAENGVDQDRLDLNTTLQWKDQPWSSKSERQRTVENQIDIAVIKIPKSLSELEEQLLAIRPCLGSNSQVLAGGMTKLIHTSTLRLFENILGATKTSLAVKKARLIFTEVDDSLDIPNNPYPKTCLLYTSPSPRDS